MQSITPLEEAISKQGLRKDWVASQLGVDKSTVTRWCKGESMPSKADRDKLVLLLRRTHDELGFTEIEKAA